MTKNIGDFKVQNYPQNLFLIANKSLFNIKTKLSVGCLVLKTNASASMLCATNTWSFMHIKKVCPIALLSMHIWN